MGKHEPLRQRQNALTPCLIKARKTGTNEIDLDEMVGGLLNIILPNKTKTSKFTRNYITLTNYRPM